MRRLAAAVLTLVLAWSWAGAAEPLKGVALVIGQSDYAHIPALANPANDARDIEKLLDELGFEVTAVTDRDARKLRRDLDRFAEDAEGADVAVLYYSGHGIEAGGDNWLVPVDADGDALAADQGLVPLSGVLDELKSTVAVSIVLLDACRSNPFPPGTVLRRDGATVAVAAAGLGLPRGVSQATAAAGDSVGTVIGFAAEPGQAALDGEPGGHSPYAAAILRHLSALQGDEFGLVMRLVTEEVYLKTGTRQRPWVNESLRRQLFFGAAYEQPAGEDGIITGERRKLLLTIAALPGAERARVERIARSDGVPLDTLYAVLAALGETDIPKDAESLDKVLKAQAGKLKAMAAESRALAIDDPAIDRLVAAADRALGEGALASARGFLDEAKDRVEKSRPTIEDVEARTKAKRIANAAVLVKSAEAAELDFDHRAAAGDYAAAFDWVKDADLKLAARYKSYEADAYQAIGSLRGDAGAFDRAIAAYEKARTLVGRNEDQRQWAKATNNLANTHLEIGLRELGTERLNRAADLYREALAIFSRERDPKEWAVAQSNLGVALQALGERGLGTSLLDEARDAFAASLRATEREKDPFGWASAKINLGTVQMSLAERTGETARLHSATRSFEQALGALDRTAHPLAWARAKNNLGASLRHLGSRERKSAHLRRSEAAYRDALTVFSREQTPVDWAAANGNLGIVLVNRGILESDNGLIERAIDYFRLALAETSREHAPAAWTKLQADLGMALQAVGQLKQDAGLLEQAAAALRASLDVRRRERDPALWAESQYLLASSLSALATLQLDDRKTDAAIAAYRASLDVYTRAAYPREWNAAMTGLAIALQGRGIQEPGEGSLAQAMAIYDELLAATPRAKAPLEWAGTMKNIAVLQFMLGTKRGSRAEVERSIASFDAALAEYDKAGDWLSRMLVNGMRQNAVEALALFK